MEPPGDYQNSEQNLCQNSESAKLAERPKVSSVQTMTDSNEASRSQVPFRHSLALRRLANVFKAALAPFLDTCGLVEDVGKLKYTNEGAIAPATTQRRETHEGESLRH